MEELPQISGKLFEQVQEKSVFPDSKTFVDSIPRKKSEEIIEEFEKSEKHSVEELRKFVEENFELPEENGIKGIDASSTREYIETSWDAFARPPDGVNPQSSLLPLEKPYIVPGGRFREVYYWDTFFIILGLIKCDEKQKALDSYKNMLDIVEKHGFIPNGNRKYYLSRSQPPVLSLAKELIEDKGMELDEERGLQMLEKELDYWKKGDKKLEVDGMEVYRYYDSDNSPRPESYREDIEAARESDNRDIFRDIRTGAESGWDFSSRWSPEGRIENLRTTDIIPVDLNCMIYGLHKETEKETELEETINELFWDDEREYYFDYDLEKGQKSDVWSLAGLLPLFYKLSSEEQAEKVKNTIERDFMEKGGLKTTLTRTGMQWDAPNGWAPLQWFAVKGLQNYGYDKLAREIASRWVQTCRNSFRRTGTLMEKYNVVKPDKEAQDGEYQIQKGFGWTNGVTVAFMEEFGL